MKVNYSAIKVTRMEMTAMLHCNPLAALAVAFLTNPNNL
jgi:hypothetical protein